MNSNRIVSVTVTGDAVCRATDTTYRIDTPWARDFLERSRASATPTKELVNRRDRLSLLPSPPSPGLPSGSF